MEVKFLVCLPDEPAEIILSTPVIRCLKTQVEDSIVIPVIRDDFSWLLSGNTHLDGMLSYLNSPEEILAPLKEQGADYLIDLDGTGRLKKIKNKMKVLDFILDRRGLNAPHGRKPLFGKPYPPGSWMERAFRTLSVFDVIDDGRGTEYKASFPDPEWMPADFLKGYLVLCLDSRYGKPSLSESRLTELAGLIEQPLIIAGGKGDREMADRIGIQVGCTVLPACGDFTDPQIASIINGSAAVLAFDPFWRLIAATLDKPLARTAVDDLPGTADWMRNWIRKQP